MAYRVTLRVRDRQTLAGLMQTLAEGIVGGASLEIAITEEGEIEPPPQPADEFAAQKAKSKAAKAKTIGKRKKARPGEGSKAIMLDMLRAGPQPTGVLRDMLAARGYSRNSVNPGLAAMRKRGYKITVQDNFVTLTEEPEGGAG